MFQTANAIGPAIAGILIAHVGLASAYWADAATYLAAFGFVTLLKPLPPHTAGNVGRMVVDTGGPSIRPQTARGARGFSRRHRGNGLRDAEGALPRDGCVGLWR